MDGNAPIRQPARPGAPVVDPAAWYTEDMLARSDEWIYRLSDAEIGDLLTAVEALESAGIDIKDITRDTFLLPVLGPTLDAIYGELTEGRGFILIRGLPVGEISRWQAGAAFYCMGTYLGRALSQNPMGHVLGHVKDMGKSYDDPMARGYQTAARMNFHSGGVQSGRKPYAKSFTSPNMGRWQVARILSTACPFVPFKMGISQFAAQAPT